MVDGSAKYFSRIVQFSIRSFGMSKKLLGTLLVVVLLLSLIGSVVVHAQEVVFVIGWEQEPDHAFLTSNSAFSSYIAEFNQRDLFQFDENRQPYGVMAE